MIVAFNVWLLLRVLLNGDIVSPMSAQHRCALPLRAPIRRFANGLFYILTHDAFSSSSLLTCILEIVYRSSRL